LPRMQGPLRLMYPTRHDRTQFVPRYFARGPVMRETKSKCRISYQLGAAEQLNQFTFIAHGLAGPAPPAANTVAI
jgi:hypothetical protein